MRIRGCSPRLCRLQQRLRPGGWLLVLERDHVAGEAVVLEPAPHLLRPGQRCLVGGELEHGPPVEVDELVDEVDRRRAVGDGEPRADPEGVDRRSCSEQPRDLVLVEVAAREDRDAGEPRAVEHLADAAAQVEQVARIEPHASEPSPARGKPASDLGRSTGALDRVVGVDQERAPVRVRLVNASNASVSLGKHSI